ncbi:hypothetical protein CTI12_AA150470 [Artemisia annua]|uniref:Uncharacterized protein n=1 Tax=Artemisia annua TaxID=35608 RepID=A0A2U1ND92_ARTAN|nr:hypothetical protein CTI12_AA150470 [Artemisia annua]
MSTHRFTVINVAIGLRNQKNGKIARLVATFTPLAACREDMMRRLFRKSRNLHGFAHVAEASAIVINVEVVTRKVGEAVAVAGDAVAEAVVKM